MLVEEPLREVGLRFGKPHARHLEYLRIGCQRLGVKQRAELPARFARQRDIPLAHVVLALERDRVGHGEIGGRVARPLAFCA